LLKIDPAGVDALILNHGHFDQYGGLIGFLEVQRAQMRRCASIWSASNLGIPPSFGVRVSAGFPP